MPTIFIFLGFRFSFYANDHEPIHVHVTKGSASAKFDVLPAVKLIRKSGFKKPELKIIEEIIEENVEIIIARWVAFFNK